MPWYAIAEPCCVSVPCFRVHDPGRTERSHQRYTGPAFERVSISSTSRGHLTLVVTSRGSPSGAGVSGYLVYPWLINGDPSTI